MFSSTEEIGPEKPSMKTLTFQCTSLYCSTNEPLQRSPAVIKMHYDIHNPFLVEFLLEISLAHHQKFLVTIDRESFVRCIDSKSSISALRTFNMQVRQKSVFLYLVNGDKQATAEFKLKDAEEMVKVIRSLCPDPEEQFNDVLDDELYKFFQ